MEENRNNTPEKKEEESFSIPSFVQQSDEKEQVDMRVFQMEEEPEKEEEPYYYEDEEYEEKPRRTKVQKQRLILVIIIAILAIFLAVTGIFYGVNRYNEMKEKEQEQLRLQEEEKKRQEEEARLKAEQEAEAKRQEEEKAKKTGTYTVQYTVRLRTGAGTDYDLVDADDLSEELQEKVDGSSLPEGVTVEVLEYKEDTEEDMVWGKIAEDAWFCIRNGEDTYATKETN